MGRYLLRQYKDSFTGLPREVWVLALVLLVNRAGTMVLPFLTIYLTDQFHMSPITAGNMIGLYGLGSIVGAFVGGKLVDRVGAIRLQTVCLFLSSITIAVIPFCRTPAALGVALFAMSAVSDAVRPANATAITRVTDLSVRTRAFALQRLAANLGLSIGPAIGGVLALFHYYWLFAIDAASTLASALVSLLIFRMRRLAGESTGTGRDAAAPSPLRDIPFVAFLSLMLAGVVVFIQLLSTYPLYLRDNYGFSKPLIGAMFALNTLIIVAIEMPLMGWIKGRNLLRTIGCGCLLVALGYGVLPWSTAAAIAVVGMVTVTVGEMLFFPLATTLVASRGTAGHEGRYLGWYMTMFAVASVIGPILGTRLYALNPHAVWYAGLAVGCCILPGFYWLALVWDETRPASPQPTEPGAPVDAIARPAHFDDSASPAA